MTCFFPRTKDSKLYIVNQNFLTSFLSSSNFIGLKEIITWSIHFMFMFCMQLAGILVDTGNLTSMHCTSKDKYISTLLINGAGRFGCDGLYQICILLDLDVHVS